MYINNASVHFVTRTAQRNLSSSDVNFVLDHGSVVYRTGIIFVFLGRRNIPKELRAEPSISRLEGVTLLIGHDGTLITAYKNPKELRTIRKKSRRNRPWAVRSAA